jgi:FdhD protein
MAPTKAARLFGPSAEAPIGRSEALEDPTFERVSRLSVEDGVAHEGLDAVAREEPLEIRVGGVAIAVVMRTPGHDEDLVRGFLLTEGVISCRQQLVSVRPCTVVDPPEAEGNVIQVRLRNVELDLARLRRTLFASSSCGLCGKTTIEAVLQKTRPLALSWRVTASVLLDLPGRLRARQKTFDRTGGLHAAGLFHPDGRAIVAREDIGRHNAVDKVVGFALDSALELSHSMLMVSGRISFEIAQKALMARIPVVAAVSAPSSLAVELGRRSNLTLAGFVRGQRLCIYSGEERLMLEHPV